MSFLTKHITIVIVLLGLPLSLQARPDTTVYRPAGYNIYDLKVDNPWLNGGNAAALSYNPGFNFSYVEAMTDYSEGAFGNAYTADYDNHYKLNAASYIRLKDIYLSGAFGYAYNYKRNIQWYGLLHPYSTPFLMADSIPGTYNLESFFIRGGLSIPLSAHWTFGSYLNYTTAAGAKGKDLRNKNTFMDFNFQPSILFHTNHIAVGMHLSYERSTENVEYTSMGSNQKNIYLYFFEGMWFCNREVFGTGTEKSRTKSDEHFGGGLQFQITGAQVKFYNEFSMQYTLQHQWNNEREFGNVNTIIFDYKAQLRFLNKHILLFNIDGEAMTGENVIQHTEWHAPSQSYQWVTDFTNQVYSRNRLAGRLSYSFRQERHDHSTNWEATAGINGYVCNMKRTSNPYTNEQWQYLEIFAGLLKRWYFKNNNFELHPVIRYGSGTGTPRETVTSSGSGGLQQAHTPLLREYDFMTADRLGAALNIGYYYTFPAKTPLQLYSRIGANFIQALSGSMKEQHRLTLQLTIGITF